jgi:diguanylate cyclase (GGDEF)-like protein
MWISSKELETKYNHKTSSLTKLAKIDSLTSIGNRRYFDEYCKELFSVKVNSEINVALIAYDLDHFKKINDTYGHSVGDQCLVAVTKAVEATIRTENSFHARTGGEEFVIVLKKTQEGDIDRIVSRIMNSMRNVKIPPHENIKLTCSIGSTNVERINGVNYLRMLEVADKAMYQAKENGRDCWVHKEYEI